MTVLVVVAVLVVGGVFALALCWGAAVGDRQLERAREDLRRDARIRRRRRARTRRLH